MYVCYDLRAIQSFIFRVPKLKYIVGGSAIVDRFDREVAPQLGDAVFCAGGKGAFRCATEQDADMLERMLVCAAHEWGLDIRLGRNEDYSEAAHCADRLYSFVPDARDGHPCQASGLYPVAAGAGRGSDRDVHPVVEARIFQRGEKLYRRFEERLLGADLDLGPELSLLGRETVFLSNIDDEDDDDGRAGAAALEGLRRWAVICMDGNDMGRQFRHQTGKSTLASDHLPRWIRAMSEALDQCSLDAARRGIEVVVRRWAWERAGGDGLGDCTAEGAIVLPIRPLVVGGDDLVVLCHPRHAFRFAKAAAQAWQERSRREAEEFTEGPLWPATGNELSISAGILFCPTTIPLSTAIPYAESLLASAKNRGRMCETIGKPAPPAVDWESVTESMLDHPAARRTRELRFVDTDIDETVELTMRPYTLDRFEELQRRADEFGPLPRSIRHDVLAGLCAGMNDRTLFRLRMAKRHPRLAHCLDEENPDSWERDRATGAGCRRTWVIDALLLLEESMRHEVR